MKKLLFLFLFLCLLVPAAPAQSRLRLENSLNTAVQQAASSRLNQFVFKQLADYYGRTDFDDPQRQTGWYRVDHFLKWMKNKETELAVQDISVNQQKIPVAAVLSNYNAGSKDMRTAFWVYLGGRYIADRYKIKADFSGFSINLCNGSNCSIGGTGALLISPDSKESIPGLINLGMHETTHILPDLTARKSPPLSELATFYSQFNYGLPVKKEDGGSFADGIRDFRLTCRLTGYKYPLENEYNLFVAGLVINDEISPERILELTSSKTGSDNIPFFLAVIGYVLAERKQYLAPRRESNSSVVLGDPAEALVSYGLPKESVEKALKSSHKIHYLGPVKSQVLSSYLAGQGKTTHLFMEKTVYDGEDVFLLRGGYSSLSPKEYIASLFPSYKPGAKLENFYRAAAHALPDYVKQDIYARYPVLSYEQYSRDKLTKKDLMEFSKKYGKEFTAAAMQALHYLKLKPASLPQGYF